MRFPEWVTKTRKNKQASARLRYIILKLCIETVSKPSFRDFARTTGLCDYSTISSYITKGGFTPGLAERFETYFGKKVVTATMLTDPMSIIPSQK